MICFFFSSRRRHTRYWRDWSSDVCSSDLFKSITHLPPFVGILLVLGVLWTATEVFYRNLHREKDEEGTMKRVTNLLSHIDMSTILFFLGILMAVACLETIGVLVQLGETLNVAFEIGRAHV